MSHDQGDDVLNTSGKDTKAWLLKLPEDIIQQLRSAPAKTKLGTLRMYKGPQAGKGAKMKLFLDRPGAEAREYDLVSHSKDQPPTFAFRDSWGGPTMLSCTIFEKIDARPVDTPEYRADVRDRTRKSAKPHRGMKVLDDGPGALALGAHIPIPETFSEAKMKVKEKEEKKARILSEKRLRVSSSELQSKLFQAFEEKPSWSKKELLEYTQQPEQWLKKHMDKLCEYHKSGQAHGLYTLKEEYQSASNRPTKKARTAEG